ncbi:MAG: hypothetical protein LBR48_00200 [Dysgonamonadaceae bacterium]|nr:hypothetical protein [Dysgonamonadaceae bacterium]
MENLKITVAPEITAACPVFSAALMLCDVTNSASKADLWDEMDAAIADFRSSKRLEDINKHPVIFATRQAYKKLGKDPNRYRPSAEALCRRILRDINLYRINTLVDAINLISIKTGYSIGGFDADKIRGSISLGVGRTGERFEAIGRGLLNIEGLPVYRDDLGGIGTPTSDEERTKITDNTSRLLMIINGYSGKEGLTEAVDFSMEVLKRYADGKNFETAVVL